MLLQGLPQKIVIGELKKHFTDEELDEVDRDVLAEFISNSETLEDLIEALDEHFSD